MLSKILFLYSIQLKKPIYDEAFLRKNCDGECGLYQVIQPNSPSKFLPKRRSQKSASSAGLGINHEARIKTQDFNDLLLPLSSLHGVGSTLARYLTRLVGGNRIFDLLLHKPLHAEKISICPRLFESQNDELIIVKAKVESHIKPSTNRQPHKVICYNPTGYLTLVFFKIFPSQIAKMKIGSEIAILGHLQRFGGENQITHPQEILPANEIEKLPKLNVVYPLTAGITQKFLTKKIHEILTKLDEKNEEWIDQNLLKQRGWPCFNQALKNLHYVKSENSETARKRLAYDELLAWQIAILLAKNNCAKNKKFIAAEKNLVEKFLASLPFKPTAAQIKAISQIESEIFSSKKMLRLLQGDVGSGKTIVAIASCLAAISQKKQTCIITPTTVLARQHLSYFGRFLENLGIAIEILTSATTKKQKAKILENLINGKIDILISTHAVFEDDVKFNNLGLAIIDEQHRFGVIQRLKLTEKSEDVDLLLMSATPIPRSLMMALYGDTDISILDEKPKNRQKIETLIMSQEKTDEVHEAVKRAVLRGEKIYWICPEIDSREMTIDSAEWPVASGQTLRTVKEKYGKLVKIFGEEKIGLLHGKMKEKEKEKMMDDFAFGDLKILVATTVIEVGIDVPSATIIIIENAENFGLSQLHQLRGRVGRSDKKSFCILLYGKTLGINGRKRLNILRQSNDGFFIAEEDLKMRGSGELLGIKQSGFPEFKIADLSCDSDLLKIARKNAEVMFNPDPSLEPSRIPLSHDSLGLGRAPHRKRIMHTLTERSAERGQENRGLVGIMGGSNDRSGLKNQKHQQLLQLFGYDECMKLLASG